MVGEQRIYYICKNSRRDWEGGRVGERAFSYNWMIGRIWHGVFCPFRTYLDVY